MERYANIGKGFFLETQVSVKAPVRKTPSLGEIKKMKEKQPYHSGTFIIILTVH